MPPGKATRRSTEPQRPAPEPSESTVHGPGNSFLGGLGGALGRESAVRRIHGIGYDTGFNAPKVPFSGDIFRATPYPDSGYNGSYGAAGGGRYNAPGNQLLYTSPSWGESVAETNAYQGMKGRTMIRSQFNTNPTTGVGGGLADVTPALQQRGMTNAVTQGKAGSSSRLWSLLGEDPYSLPHNVGKGAIDSGASAMRVPSATGGNQINIVPKNTSPSQIRHLDVTPHDAHANPGATSRATSVQPMTTDPTSRTPSRLSPQHTIKPGQPASGSTAATPPRTRSGSVRYGAAGGGLMGLGTGLYDYSQGNASLGDVATSTGVGTGGGAVTAAATDQLLRRGMSVTKAGGLVGGVIEGGMSTWDNAQAYRNGDISGGQATANVVVDTGVGVGAGMAGAAAGAAIGSIIPGAGTLVGAGLGFLGGMAASYVTNALAEHTGFKDWAKETLGAGFEWAGDKAGQAVDWAGEKAGQAREWVGEKATQVGGAIRNGAAYVGEKAGEAREWVGEKASQVGGAIRDGAGYVAEGARQVGARVVDAGGRALNRAAEVGSAAVSSVRNGAAAVGGALSSGASAVGGAISNAGSAVSGGAKKAWKALTGWW